jgi:hypothetical protein
MKAQSQRRILSIIVSKIHLGSKSSAPINEYGPNIFLIYLVAMLLVLNNVSLNAPYCLSIIVAILMRKFICVNIIYCTT